MPSARKPSIRTFFTGSVRAEQWKKSMLPFMPYLVTFVVMWILYLHFYSKELINNEAAMSLDAHSTFCDCVIWRLFGL